MSKLPLWTASIGAAVILLSACGQTDPGQTVSKVETAATTADQTEWKGYTDKANDALKSGDKAAAEENYKQAIAAAKKLGENDPAVAEAIANAASFYYVQGDGEQADELYSQSLALREANKGKEHADLIQDLIGLAKVRMSQKKYADACTFFERATAIAKKSGTQIDSETETQYENAKKLSES